MLKSLTYYLIIQEVLSDLQLLAQQFAFDADLLSELAPAEQKQLIEDYLLNSTLSAGSKIELLEDYLEISNYQLNEHTFSQLAFQAGELKPEQQELIISTLGKTIWPDGNIDLSQPSQLHKVNELIAFSHSDDVNVRKSVLLALRPGAADENSEQIKHSLELFSSDQDEKIRLLARLSLLVLDSGQ